MLWEIFLPLIAFLGLIIGIILAKVSPEEMKPGKKYFAYFRLIVLAVLIFALLYYTRSNPLFFLMGLVIGYFFRLTYLYLGLALASSFLASKNYIFLVSSLVFLYGFPYGTLLESKYKFNLKKLGLLAGMFALPFVILLFSSYLNPKMLFALTAGLLIGSFRKVY